MKNIRMFQQRVLISQDPDEPTTHGGLFVPETVAKNIAKGKIQSVDEGKLRVGDQVLFDTRQAIAVKLEGQEFVVVHESQILAVLGRQKQKKTHS
jgi:chaperonin GroES